MIERWWRLFARQGAVGKIALVVGTLIGVQVLAGMFRLPGWFRSDLMGVFGPVLLLVLVVGLLFARSTGRGPTGRDRW
jgi:hypothetical protein